MKLVWFPTHSSWLLATRFLFWDTGEDFCPFQKYYCLNLFWRTVSHPCMPFWPCGDQAGRSQIKGRLQVIFLSFFLVKRKEHLQKGCLPAVLCAVCCFWRSHHSAKEQWRASCSLGERELSRTQVAGQWPHWPGLKSPNLQVNSLQWSRYKITAGS